MQNTVESVENRSANLKYRTNLCHNVNSTFWYAGHGHSLLCLDQIVSCSSGSASSRRDGPGTASQHVTFCSIWCSYLCFSCVVTKIHFVVALAL